MKQGNGKMKKKRNRYGLQTGSDNDTITPSANSLYCRIARGFDLASNGTKIVNSGAFLFKLVCARFERNKSGDKIRAGVEAGAEEFGEEIAVIMCSLPKAIASECFLFIHVLTPETLVRYSSGFRHRRYSIGSMADKTCTNLNTSVKTRNMYRHISDALNRLPKTAHVLFIGRRMSALFFPLHFGSTLIEPPT